MNIDTLAIIIMGILTIQLIINIVYVVILFKCFQVNIKNQKHNYHKIKLEE